MLVLEKRQQKAVKRLPLGSASQEIINSKVDVLNKRVSRLEQKERKKEKPKTVKAIVKKRKKENHKIPNNKI